MCSAYCRKCAYTWLLCVNRHCTLALVQVDHKLLIPSFDVQCQMKKQSEKKISKFISSSSVDDFGDVIDSWQGFFYGLHQLFTRSRRPGWRIRDSTTVRQQRLYLRPSLLRLDVGVTDGGRTINRGVAANQCDAAMSQSVRFTHSPTRFYQLGPATGFHRKTNGW